MINPILFPLVSQTVFSSEYGVTLKSIDLLKIKYLLAYETTTKITQYLKQTRNYQTSDDEQMYLTIHYLLY